MKIRISVLLLVILHVLLIFTACSNSNDELDKIKSESKEETNMIHFESGVYYNKEWDDTIGTYTGDVIPNEKCAIEIATAIFNSIPKSDELVGAVPQSVFLDEQDDVWIVSFWKNSNEIIIGGDCSIALQKKDGKVLRISFGE